MATAAGGSGGSGGIGGAGGGGGDGPWIKRDKNMNNIYDIVGFYMAVQQRGWKPIDLLRTEKGTGEVRYMIKWKRGNNIGYSVEDPDVIANVCPAMYFGYLNDIDKMY